MRTACSIPFRIVEVENEDIFHFRHVQASDYNSITDMGIDYLPDGSIKNMEETLLLFKKTMKGEDNKSWDTYFMTNKDGQNITARLTDNAKADIVKSGIDFPLQITVGDNDYFITTEKYTNNDGVEKKFAVCVLQGITKIEKADVKKKTLTDYFRDKALEDKGL